MFKDQIANFVTMPKFVFTLLVLVTFHWSIADAQRMQLDSLIKALDNTEIDSQRVIILNEIAFHNININPIIARDDVMIAYNEAKEINFVRGQARALVVMGGVNWGFGNYKEALTHYLEALTQYQILNDKKGQSDCLNNIGEVYKKLGEYSSALEFLQRARRLKEDIEGIGGPLLLYSNLGELYSLMGQLEKAETHYMIAFEGAKRKNNDKVLSYASDGLGILFYKKGKYKTAIMYFQKAAKIREHNKDIRGSSYTFTNLGRTYTKLGLVDSAYYYLDKGFQRAKQASANDVRANIYRYKSVLDSLTGDFHKSYLNYRLYAELKDSLYNTDKAAQITKLQTDYEINILQRENEAKQLEVKQKNTVIIAVIMLLILTLALANAFYKQRLAQKKANELLLLKNSEIENKNLEIQSQSMELQSLNLNLEDKIKKRTSLLREQNRVLKEYAFVHAHELRAPLANIMGLVELLRHTELPNKESTMVQHLYTSSTELDQVIKKIAAMLEDEGQIKPLESKLT